MANAAQLRQQNLYGVISAVHAQPGISKPEVGSVCGLVPSTVHSLVEALHRDGLLLQTGQGKSTGGRRAARYEINPKHRYILAASLKRNCAEIGLLDLALSPISSQTLPLSLEGGGAEAYVSSLSAGLAALLGQAGLDSGQIAGIGVSVPGTVDRAQGIIWKIPGLAQWDNYPLAARLNQSLDLPVLVDKDVFMGLQYLRYARLAKPEENVAYVMVEQGISAALMLDGQVFRGSHGLAGEIGHVSVRRDGVRCRCGNKGCLELYCSDSGIIDQYNSQIDRPAGEIGQVIDRARAGEQTAQRMLLQAVNYMADAMSALIVNYDPGKIVIHCRWLQAQQGLFLGLMDNVYDKSMFTKRRDTDIQLLDEANASLLAAGAAVATGYLLEPDSPLAVGRQYANTI